MVDRPIIAPSILSADFARLGEEIRMVTEAGAQWIHVDVMDGHFVPNITIGPPVVRSLYRTATVPLDVHLMITDPSRYVEDFAKAGASAITVHVEAEPHLHRCLQTIKGRNCKAGVSLNPATPLSSLDACLSLVDLVLVMAVNPGFGGQTFIQETHERIKTLVQLRKERDLTFLISVDGGVNRDNAETLFHNGADILIAGNAVFGSDDPVGTINHLNALRRST